MQFLRGKLLGHVEVDVIIGDLEGKKRIKVTALVDTGATFTVIPENISKDLNLTYTGEKVKVSTAKGYDELDLVHAILEIDKKRRIMPVLISKHIDRVLIGVITLEAMQLRVNPLTGKLEEYTILLY
ncbi:MAG: retroviral-like aspartic protease family protein [Thermoprotei archaeon]|jgi:clan AA aspartic protease